jgi:hypothetical protein
MYRVRISLVLITRTYYKARFQKRKVTKFCLRQALYNTGFGCVMKSESVTSSKNETAFHVSKLTATTTTGFSILILLLGYCCVLRQDKSSQ